MGTDFAWSALRARPEVLKEPLAPPNAPAQNLAAFRSLPVAGEGEARSTRNIFLPA